MRLILVLSLMILALGCEPVFNDLHEGEISSVSGLGNDIKVVFEDGEAFTLSMYRFYRSDQWGIGQTVILQQSPRTHMNTSSEKWRFISPEFPRDVIW